MITREFKLYLNAGVGVAPVINANQFDQDEEWIFTLLQNDGTVYTPSTGAIIGLKQDGTTILNAGTVNSSGQVVITETEQMTAVPGSNIFELLIDGNSHGTANFVVFVERRPGDIDNPSESDISLFQEAIEAAGNVTQFQADISALQSGLATTNINLTSEANTRASADATLQSNISTEASTRQTQDAVLQAEIDQIIAPTGEAPSAAEVQNARIGVDGTTYDTLGNAIRGQVSDLKNALNSDISSLVVDFTWITGKKYNLSTGVLENQNNFNCTLHIKGDDFTKRFNYETISGTSPNVVFMWLNNVYVGYYYRSKYYDPSGTQISKPSYNEWAIMANNSTYTDYHPYTVVYQTSINEIQDTIAEIETETVQLIDDFTWTQGYYSFTTGVPTGSSTGYHRTNKMRGTQFEFADSTVFDGSSSNFISFWYQDTYVGYYLDGKYYDQSRTQVESVTYDEWATNIYTSNYEQLKPNSLGNRVTNLENSEQSSPLQGKKLGCIGDSIAAGAGFSGGYGGIIANDYGMVIDNNAVNGSVLVPQQSLSTIIPQLNALDSDCDYVILEGGFNDSWLASPIGVYNDSYAEPTTDDTFYGNLNYLLYTAVHKYAGKKVCYLIVHAGKTEYSCMIDTYPYYEATVKLCRKWGVPIVDLNQNCVPFGLLPVSDQIRTTYTANSGDGVHPNEAGYRKYYVPQIVAMLESL